MSTAILQQNEAKPKLEPDYRGDVAQRVLDLLGRPELLARIDAKKLSDRHFRVNVFCTVDPDRPLSGVQITDSYFVTVVEDGIVCDPPITKKYG